jgi:two-component system LytT family response regulator
MMLNAYIVDDERHAITVLAGFIARTPGIELAGSSTSPLAALGELGTLPPPDLLFLDIDMEELNGLEMVRMVDARTRIVLTTSFREYGPEAYALSVADYLLKPVSYERFLQCVQKLRQERSPQLPSASHMPPFFVKTAGCRKLTRRRWFMSRRP